MSLRCNFCFMMFDYLENGHHYYLRTIVMLALSWGPDGDVMLFQKVLTRYESNVWTHLLI